MNRENLTLIENKVNGRVITQSNWLTGNESSPLKRHLQVYNLSFAIINMDFQILNIVR